MNPANGATGVAADAPLVITFSEPVDRSTAETAFTSNAGNVTVSWDETGTILTAMPNNPLVYVESTNANAPAMGYTMSINGELRDLANNTTEANTTSAFTTLRRISIQSSVMVTSMVILTSYGGGGVNSANNDGGATIGDGFGNEYNRVPINFDIAALPDTLASITSATLQLEILLSNPAGGSSWGTPFVNLGALNVVHFYDNPIDASSLDLAPLGTIGALIGTSNPTAGVKTIDVTDAVNNDFTERATRNKRAQFRIQFATKTDNDGNPDLVTVRPYTTTHLNMTYLAP